jgi:hypothetical protein
MIVDCFTHTWESLTHLGRCVPTTATRPQSGPPGWANAGAQRHLLAAEPVDYAFVLGFKSHYLGADISNDLVAAHVKRHSDRFLGFAGVDPSQAKEAVAELHRARQELGMVGLAVAPAAQDFHPSDTHAMTVYAEAAKANMPVIFHTGVNVCPAAKLQYAQPVLLDEIAGELPQLKIVIAHMGYPWINETIALLEKHPNVYAEVSWLLDQHWQAYQALLAAYHADVIDKLLFGSGFPHAPASAGIEGLYSINHLCQGTNLPSIPREQLRGIVERDALSLLGVVPPSGLPRRARPQAVPVDDADDA